MVSIVAQEAPNGDAVAKLNSGSELERGPVDQVLDLDRLNGLAPMKELLR